MYDDRLKYLNLNNNEIYSIPQLKLLGTSPLKHSELQQPRLSSSKITMDSTTPSTDHGAVSHDHLMDGDQTQTTDNTANHDPIENVQSTELKQQSLDASSPIIGEVKSNKSVTDDTNALKSETLLPQAPPNTALPVGQTASVPKQTMQSLHVLPKSTPCTPTKPLTNPLYSSISAPYMLTNSVNTPPLHTQPVRSHGQITPGYKCTPECEIDSRLNDYVMLEQDGSLKDVAPFPALETLSLVNNLVIFYTCMYRCAHVNLQNFIVLQNPFRGTYTCIICTMILYIYLSVCVSSRY